MFIVHISDIHLNFCDANKIGENISTAYKARQKLLKSINDNISKGGEIILLTGDISESPTLTSEVFWLSENLKRPLYYVLGNHDFYHSDFRTGEIFANCANKFIKLDQQIIYLPARDFVKLNADTILLGFNGLYDCRNFKRNELEDFIDGIQIQNDFQYNKNLKEIYDLCESYENKLKLVQYYADNEVNIFEQKLLKLIKTNEFSNINKIIIATHVPPIYYKNPNVKYEYDLPGFDSNKKFLELLCKYSEEYKSIQFTVFCGHNHYGGYSKLDNLEIFCKKSQYGYPDSILIKV